MISALHQISTIEEPRVPSIPSTGLLCRRSGRFAERLTMDQKKKSFDVQEEDGKVGGLPCLVSAETTNITAIATDNRAWRVRYHHRRSLFGYWINRRTVLLLCPLLVPHDNTPPLPCVNWNPFALPSASEKYFATSANPVICDISPQVSRIVATRTYNDGKWDVSTWVERE